MGFWDRVKDRVEKVVGEEAAPPARPAPAPEPSQAPAPVTSGDAGAEVVVPEAALPQEQRDEKPARTYTVQPGDTLTDIARKHETDEKSVIAIGNLQHPDRIYPGQVLQIP